MSFAIASVPTEPEVRHYDAERGPEYWRWQVNVQLGPCSRRLMKTYTD